MTIQTGQLSATQSCLLLWKASVAVVFELLREGSASQVLSPALFAVASMSLAIVLSVTTNSQGVIEVFEPMPGDVPEEAS